MTVLDFVVGAVLVVVAVTLLAFAVGRRLGLRQGHRRAFAEAPVRLRMQALQSGMCPVCNRRP